MPDKNKSELSNENLEKVNGGFNNQTIGDIEGKIRHDHDTTYDGNGKTVPIP